MEIGNNLTAVIIATLGLIGSVVTAILGVISVRKQNQVIKATDGMKDALVAAKSSEATEIGKAAGVEAERVRTETAPPAPVK